MASGAYLEWCAQHGIQLNGITAGEVQDGGRGIIATTPLEKDSPFLEVPEDLLISCRSARHDPVLGPMLDTTAAAGLDSYQVLAVHLLHEVSKVVAPAPCGADSPTPPAGFSQPASKWSPYLKELPRTYTTFSYWSKEAAKQLQLDQAYQAATEAVEKLEAAWKQAKPLMEQLGVPAKYRSLGAWRWAAATLLSRTMHVPWDVAGALTPFGDLLNHQSPAGPCTPVVLPADTQPAAGCLMPDHPLEEQPHDQEQQQTGEAMAALLSSRSLAESPQASVEANQAPAETLAPAAGSPAAPAAPQAVLLATVEQSGDSCSSSCQHTNEDDQGTPLQAEPQPPALWGDGAYDAEAKAYKLYARRRYEPGQQVYVSYGQHNNLELLDLYGFLLLDNPHETAQIPLQLLEAACRVNHAAGAPVVPPTQVSQLLAVFVHARRAAHGVGAGSSKSNPGGKHKSQPTLADLMNVARQVLVDHDGDDDGSRQAATAWLQHDTARLPDTLCAKESFVHWDGAPSWQLLQALRTVAATPLERRRYSRLLATGERVSASGDILALTWLSQAAAALLTVMPTSLEQDQQLLRDLAADSSTAGTTLDPEHQQLAIQWRLGYKRTLLRSCEYCLNAIRQLQELV